MDDPVAFSKHNLSMIDHARFFLNKYKRLLKFEENEDILEIGSASGVITKEVLFPFIEKHVNTLLAADISQHAVETANSLYAGPKISFRQMDIEEENLWKRYEGKFGHIFAFYLLHLLKFPERWSKNIFEMLKPKGQFFGSVLLTPPGGTNIMAAQKADITKPWAKHMETVPDLCTDYGPDHSGVIANILVEAGFTVIMREVQPMTVSFKTIEDLNGVLLSANPFLKHIPEDVRGYYVEDFIQKISEYFKPSNGESYSRSKNVLCILANKE